MLAYLRALLKDPLFTRVCMFFWGLPLAFLGVYAAVSWHPTEGYEWFGIALLVAIGFLGVCLLGVSALGSNALVDKSTDFMHEGGDLIGVIFVLVVVLFAIPVTAVLRALRRGNCA
jgi:hypothetical protein